VGAAEVGKGRMEVTSLGFETPNVKGEKKQKVWGDCVVK